MAAIAVASEELPWRKTRIQARMQTADTNNKRCGDEI